VGKHALLAEGIKPAGDFISLIENSTPARKNTGEDIKTNFLHSRVEAPYSILAYSGKKCEDIVARGRTPPPDRVPGVESGCVILP